MYEVNDEVTNRRRALKVMLPLAGREASLARRFEQEARITGRIESDHIVQVSDAGIEEGSNVPFVVMELLQGEEMGSLSRRKGPLPAADVVLYLSQVALALEKTHAAGIVHRDLKPENLFATQRDDGSVCVKILDFGAAKMVVHHSLMERTAIVGTPIYMAPEQIRGDGSVGPQVDIHALGHLAYVLLTSEPYWAPEARLMLTVYVLFQKILAGPPEPASVRAARRKVTLSASFDGWFARTTALDPRDRPDRAAKAVLGLAEALGVPAPRSIQAHNAPPGRPSDPPPSWAPRNPAPPPAPAPKVPVSPFAPTVDASPESSPKKRAKTADTDERDALLRDKTTQVYTERYLKTQLEKEYILARKNRTHLSALVFELERPEKDAGDDALAKATLSRLADALRTYRPKGACLALCGKETFVLLVPGAGKTRTRAIATVVAPKVQERLSASKGGPKERLRRELLRKEEPRKEEPRAKLLVGVAYLEKADTSGRELLDRALGAMRAGGQ